MTADRTNDENNRMTIHWRDWRWSHRHVSDYSTMKARINQIATRSPPSFTSLFTPVRIDSRARLFLSLLSPSLMNWWLCSCWCLLNVNRSLHWSPLIIVQHRTTTTTAHLSPSPTVIIRTLKNSSVSFGHYHSHRLVRHGNIEQIDFYVKIDKSTNRIDIFSRNLFSSFDEILLFALHSSHILSLSFRSSFSSLLSCPIKMIASNRIFLRSFYSFNHIQAWTNDEYQCRVSKALLSPLFSSSLFIITFRSLYYETNKTFYSLTHSLISLRCKYDDISVRKSRANISLALLSLDDIPIDWQAPSLVRVLAYSLVASHLPVEQ